jgi:hypothetical protein
MSLKLASQFNPEIYKYNAEHRFSDPLCGFERNRLRQAFEKALHLIEAEDFYLLETHRTLTAYFKCDMQQHLFGMALMPNERKIMAFKPDEYFEEDYPEFITGFENKFRGTSLEGRIKFSISKDKTCVLIQIESPIDFLAFYRHYRRKEPVESVIASHCAQLGL